MNYQNYVTFLLDLDKEELYMAEFKQNSIRVWNSFRLVIIFHIQGYRKRWTGFETAIT